MKATITNIRNAYNDTTRYASQNSDIVKFIHAVREIDYKYYDEIQSQAGDGKKSIYLFIQKKMKELNWDGCQFNK